MDLMTTLQVTHNARELRDLHTEDGSVIAPGVLFRSDALAGLTDAGLRALADLRIGTVIDLRTDGERARAADVLPADGSVTLIPLAMQGGAMDEMAKSLLPADGSIAQLTDEQLAQLTAQIPTLEDLYRAILASSAPQFVAVARAVIAAAGTDRPGVLVHCTAGKDRTGLASAVLLSVAGVRREEIVADYTRTGSNLAGDFAASLTGLITSVGIPLTPELKTLATESPATAIEAALDFLDTEYGGASGYLASGGLTPADIGELRAALRND